MELRTTRIFERFSTTVSKNKQRYAESDPTLLYTTIHVGAKSADSALTVRKFIVCFE